MTLLGAIFLDLFKVLLPPETRKTFENDASGIICHVFSLSVLRSFSMRFSIFFVNSSLHLGSQIHPKSIQKLMKQIITFGLLLSAFFDQFGFHFGTPEGYIFHYFRSFKRLGSPLGTKRVPRSPQDSSRLRFG